MRIASIWVTAQKMISWGQQIVQLDCSLGGRELPFDRPL